MIKRVAKLILIVSFLVTGISSFGQNVRGFYLTGIGNWLGDSIKETEILEYAQGNGFNYLTLYDMNTINWSSSSVKSELAAFIKRARNQYGVTEIGAVIEVYASLRDNIIPYNNSRSNADEKFDVINQEFEFWIMASISSAYCHKYLIPNGYSCDTAGAFAFSWKEFKKIDSCCAANGLISEVYLGWPTKGQMQKLMTRVDRLLLHAYRATDADVYAYSRNRLMDIASSNLVKKVIPIFSNEPVFMGPWLATHAINQPYQTYANDFAAETSSFKNNIDLQGYHWFHYELMPQTILATSSITANGPLSFCSGGTVTLTASAGVSYLCLRFFSVFWSGVLKFCPPALEQDRIGFSQ